MASIEIEVAGQKMEVEIIPEEIITSYYDEDYKFAKYFYEELEEIYKEDFHREFNLTKQEK